MLGQDSHLLDLATFVAHGRAPTLYLIAVAVGLVVLIGTGVSAARKGYQPVLWALGGVLSFEILLFLPDANAPGLDSAARSRMVARSHWIGAVALLAAAAILLVPRLQFVLAIIAWSAPVVFIASAAVRASARKQSDAV